MKPAECLQKPSLLSFFRMRSRTHEFLVDMADQISMLALGVEGYFVSPDEADQLEASLANGTWDEIPRWKLLGFFYAHKLCCYSKYRVRRVNRIVEMIENHKSLEHGCRHFLEMTFADGGINISTVRAA